MVFQTERPLINMRNVTKNGVIGKIDPGGAVGRRIQPVQLQVAEKPTFRAKQRPTMNTGLNRH